MRTTRSRTSGENCVDFPMTPSSQMLVPSQSGAVHTAASQTYICQQKKYFGHNSGMRYPAVKTYRRLILAVVVGLVAGQVQAQAPTPPGGNLGLELPPSGSAQKVNEFLSTLKPPTNFKALENGNNLKLTLPDIAASGPVNVGLLSTLPRTDAMWLLTLEPRPDSGASLFFSVALEPSTRPEASMIVDLYKTQHILLVARAGGKYYGVYRQIKIGVPSVHGTSK